MILTTGAVYADCMRNLIRIRIGELTEELVFGAAVGTLEAYKERVGQLRGLKEALELMEEAEKEVSMRERGL